MNRRTIYLMFLAWLGIGAGAALPFSLEYIQTKLDDSLDYTPILQKMKKITLPPDVQVNYLDSSSRKSIQADTVCAVLYQCLADAAVLTRKHTSLKAELTKGLLWHQLSRFGAAPAFDKADSIFRKASSAWPRAAEGPWFRAVNRIEHGWIFEGIMTLDSLSRTGTDNQEFWSDFIKYTFLAFMPNRRNYNEVREMVLVRDSGEGFAAPAGAKDAPHLYRWEIFSGQGKDQPPDFRYHFTFSFKNQWKQDLFPPGSFAIVRSPETPVPQYYSSSIFNAILSQETQSSIFISFDFRDTAGPLPEYAANQIKGLFDSVSAGSEFYKYNALSLKCFRRNANKNQYGSFAWLIAFDRYCAGRDPPAKEPRFPFRNRKIRYLLLLNSCKSDREQAEKQYRAIINAFVVI